MNSEVFQEQGKSPCQGRAVGLCLRMDSWIIWILSLERKWANSSLRPRLLCHLRTPWHVHSRLILPPLFLREVLLSTASELFLELPCSCVCWYGSCGSQSCEGLDWCDQKRWWSLPEFIFENDTSLNSQSEKRGGMGSKELYESCSLFCGSGENVSLAS